MNLKTTRIGSAVISLGLLLAGCGGGGGSGSSLNTGGGSFSYLRVTPTDNATLFLNDAIQIDFTTQVDLTTADLNSVSFNVFDLTGTALGEQPRGYFRLGTSPGDSAPGRRLEFVPLLPTDDLYSNGGFKPGRRYVVQLVGGDRRNGVVLRDVRGRELSTPISFSFTTVDGSTANELFRNTRQNGPRRAGFEVLPSTLNSSGTRVVDPSFNAVEPLEVRLTFDQPVNPQKVNVPAAIDLDARLRDDSLRGRVFLEYDDPSVGGENRWIPAQVELERNDLEGAVVVLRPIGALPNNAVVDVRVLNTFEDVAGESNVADAAYVSLFGQFVVEPRHEPQFDALVERFEGANGVDLSTPFLEPVAELTDEGLRASLAFEGEDSTLDYEPSTPTTILNTDFTRVSLRAGRSLNVSGGVFQFRNVTIPAGYTVTGEGSKPMVWLVTGDMTIAGTLTVNGNDGERVSSTSADLPSAGGSGQCGGGRGGRGSVLTSERTKRAESGFGPDNEPAGGGEGGQHSCEASSLNNCRIGSGGGGGSFASKGDPDFYTRFPIFRGTGTGLFDSQSGDGRVGCQNKSSSNQGVGPGSAGQVGFLDADENNNFLGVAVRFTDGEPSSRLAGELASARGGSGGGGGGDGATDCNNVSNWRTDAKGGGGGGGAGVLIIKCLGRVKVLSGGKITANGGFGGGGYPNGTSAAGSNTAAGAGGGGGSGGMVVVMCSALDLVRHGTAAAAAYGNATTTNRADGPYDFAIMADGGVGQRNPAAGFMAIRGKYPDAFLSNETPHLAGSWHNDIGDRPVGGFGGNGVVQLMTPSLGDVDGTGSFFDDSIEFYATDADLEASTPLPAATKKTLLGWRGYRASPNNQTRIDDLGATITISENGFGIGDIKPSPVLLPVPFGPLSRAVSEPLDLGRVDRLPTNVAQGVRAIIERGTSSGDPFTNLLAGPTYAFDGTSWPETSSYQGYLAYDANGAQTAPVVAGSASAVARVVADAEYNSRPAYRVELATSNAVLAQIPGRYTGYLAQLLGAGGGIVAELRVLGHDGTTIHLDPSGDALPSTAVTTVQLVASFVAVETNGARGLGPAVSGVPQANVRIGFAFYKDATDPATRFPTSGFEYGLNVANSDLVRALRAEQYRYVQYDIVFNTLFSPTAVNNIDTTRKLRPSLPRPVVKELVLPFQF
ncbi:MAG: hypothetical protein R3F56_06040 [Planctomycetota bacterium]